MSLSLHSSRDALTSSKRGLEKDSDIEPLKSSIGEISSRISASPPTAEACSSGERVARHSGLPISQSNEVAAEHALVEVLVVDVHAVGLGPVDVDRADLLELAGELGVAGNRLVDLDA